MKLDIWKKKNWKNKNLKNKSWNFISKALKSEKKNFNYRMSFKNHESEKHFKNIDIWKNIDIQKNEIWNYRILIFNTETSEKNNWNYSEYSINGRPLIE
jgi:hypothetical protein